MSYNDQAIGNDCTVVTKPLDSKPLHAFDHKLNMYSKSMANTTTCTSALCHMMQIILSIFYMHVSFTSPTLLSYLAQRFSQNVRVHM
jgi:hypothetical protein